MVFYYDQNGNYKVGDVDWNHIVDLPHCMSTTVVWFDHRSHDDHHGELHNGTISIPINYKIYDLIAISKNTIIGLCVDCILIIDEMVIKEKYDIEVCEDFRVCSYYDGLIFYNDGYYFQTNKLQLYVAEADDYVRQFYLGTTLCHIKLSMKEYKVFVDNKTIGRGLYVKGFILFDISKLNMTLVFSPKLKIATMIFGQICIFANIEMNKRTILYTLINGLQYVQSLKSIHNAQKVEYATLTKPVPRIKSAANFF